MNTNGDYANLEMEVIPTFLAMWLGEDDSDDDKSLDTQEGGKSCPICMIGGRFVSAKCCWQEHRHMFEEQQRKRMESAFSGIC